MKLLAALGWIAAVAASVAAVVLYANRGVPLVEVKQIGPSVALSAEQLGTIPEGKPADHLAGVRVVGMKARVDGEAGGLTPADLASELAAVLVAAGITVAEQGSGVNGVVEARVTVHPSGPAGTLSVRADVLLYREVISAGDNHPVRAPVAVWQAGAGGAGSPADVKAGAVAVTRDLGGRLARALTDAR